MAWEIRKHQQQFDRISELSDDLLGQILSSLPIKEVLRTSILSKRWKSVWTFVGAVVIRDSDLFRSVFYDSSPCFVNFVERVFNHVVGLRKLELDCNHYYVEQWIDIVTNKLNAHAASLHELDLSLSGPTSMYHLVKLPQSIFTSQNLVILKLSFEVDQLILPSSSSSTVFWLPRLKVLHLKKSMDLSCLENLLAGCPVLEELFMKGGKYNQENRHQMLRINSSSLKRLILRFYTNIQIDATNLEELQFRISSISVVNTTLPLLKRLTIDISPAWMKVKKSEDDTDIGSDSDFEDFMQYHVPPTNYSLMPSLHHLENVELEDFQGREHEMDLVTYLLEKAPVLKTMTLLFGTSDQITVASQLHNRIVMIPKASAACEVNVLFYDSMSGHYISRPYSD